jgi:hypothetical protein
VLGKAWQDGECFENNLPDPGRNFSGYVKAMVERYQVPTEVCKKFIMRPRCYAAYRISDEDGANPLAVVVFESCKHDGIDEASLRELMKVGGEALLRQFIVDHHDIEPEWSDNMQLF